MGLTKKILKEYSEDILNKKIKNPETGRNIKISSALGYDKSEPVEQAAEEMIQKLNSGPSTDPGKAIKVIPDTDIKKNERSHKPKSASYGISKECVEYLKSKGYKGLNAYPQSFVKIEDIQFNPALKKVHPDKTWICKFPIIKKDGTAGKKTAYTSGFMKKSQVKKYKKISKIKDEDILNLETKTTKLLSNKNTILADSACILKIILKTGLRIGSLDEEDSDTGNLGVRTLKKANVHIENGKAHLKFIGKSYQDNIATIDDADVVAFLSKKINSLKNDEDRLFSASYGQVGQVMRKINPKGINPKDLRTYKATQFAKELLADRKLGPPPPLPKDPKQIKKLVKEKLKAAFAKIAEMLNNSPAMARNSYIHPIVITNYLDRLGLTPKEVGYKHVTLESKLGNKMLIETDEIAETVIPEQTMDDLFAQYPDYGVGIDDSEITDEDSDECEEYPLPRWFWDDKWDLVPKEELNESLSKPTIPMYRWIRELKATAKFNAFSGPDRPHICMLRVLPGYSIIDGEIGQIFLNEEKEWKVMLYATQGNIIFKRPFKYEELTQAKKFLEDAYTKILTTDEYQEYKDKIIGLKRIQSKTPSPIV